MPLIQAVLFDLDGTLIDTAPDLIHALNHALTHHGYPAQRSDAMRAFVSHGSFAMVKAAQPTLEEPQQRLLQQALLDAYQQCNGEQARLFAGFQQVLSEFDRLQIPYGIITNKPARFTRPLLEKLQLTDKLSCIISFDSCTRAKPDPAPMLLGAMQTGIEPQHILYVGDHRRDIQAASAVNMQSAAALWGYLDLDDDPKDWQADYQLDSPLALLQFFTNGVKN